MATKEGYSEGSSPPLSHEDVIEGLQDQLVNIRGLKSMAGSSDQARALAVSATELEKVIAYYRVYVSSGSTKQGTSG